jgi:D-sedoheptulose 7-phosphate isomerase
MVYFLDAAFNSSGAPSQYVKRYFERVAELMRAVDLAALEQVVQAIEGAIEGRRTLFLIANGGSSAVASHFVNDAVVGAMVDGKPPLRALSLSDNVESVTAIANDAGYENIFAYQLKTLLNPGDLVLALSVSGNSENILRGVATARQMGGLTIGWSGFDGGRLAKTCDLSLVIATTGDEYGPVEDMFSILEHAILTWLTLRRGRPLHHC